MGEWIEKYGSKLFHKDNFVIMLLVGILLVVVALPTKKIEKNREQINTTATSVGVHENLTGSSYEKEQEDKLKAKLSQMAGVGEVEVMLTFVASEEKVTLREEPIKRNSTVERDSSGGERCITQYEKGDAVICVGADGTDSPYVVKTVHPKVDGVLVIAQGAGDGTVNRSIAEAVTALYGVEAHRIKILPMSNKHISQVELIQ